MRRVLHVTLASALVAVAIAPRAAVAQQTVLPADQPRMVAGDVVPPVLLTRVEPEYPQSAQVQHVTGQVTLRAVVTERGDIADLEVLESNPLLDRSAIEAVKQWKYQPATLNGRAVSVYITVVVNFAIDLVGEVVAVDRDGALVDFGADLVVFLPRPATLTRPRPDREPERLGEVTVQAVVDREGQVLYRVSLDHGLTAQDGDRVTVVDGPSSPPPVTRSAQADAEKIVELLRAILPAIPSSGFNDSMRDRSRWRWPHVSDADWADATRGVSLDAMLESIAPTIQRRLTADEVDEAITFFRSGPGRRLVDTLVRDSHEISLAAASWRQAVDQRIEEHLRARGYRPRNEEE